MEPDKSTKPNLLIPASHPSEDQLEKYALGRLSEPEIEKIEIHLLICEACQNELTATDQYVAAMKGALEERPLIKAAPVPPKSWMSWRPVPAFSLALAALSVAVVVTYNIYPSRPGESVSRSEEPVKIVLRSVRGAQEAAEGPANSPLDLTVQSDQIKIDASYKAELVDSVGTPVWHGTPTGNTLKIGTSLKPGSYWVRLRDADGNLLQEYGLHLK